MRSLKQIQASRANGARSRGPITAQSKRNSSRNSTRHGFSAPDPSLDHDPPAAFVELRAGFMASLRPRNVAEAQLIHTMAVAHWRKLQVIEAQTISMNYSGQGACLQSVWAQRSTLCLRISADGQDFVACGRNPKALQRLQ